MKSTNSTIGIKVPLFSGEREYRFFRAKLHRALDKVGRSGRWLLGEQTQRLENRLSRLLRTKFAIACSSGTDAIFLSLLSLGISHGDEVILPANCYPSVFGVTAAGAKPVLVDVNHGTGNLDPRLLSSAITRKTKAILAVHLYGQPADLSEIKVVADAHRVPIIEDCAQALGTTYKGKPVGSFGALGAFSFYPTKPIGACGDAGAVVTNKRQLFTRLLMARQYGERKRYASEFVSRNCRIDELQAAFLLVKLALLRRGQKHRQTLARLYRNNLAGLPDLVLPFEAANREHVYHLFVVRTKQRNKLQRWLRKSGIETGVHYPVPIYRVKPFSSLGDSKSYPITESLSQTSLSLPLYNFMRKSEVIFVAKRIRAFFHA